MEKEKEENGKNRRRCQPRQQQTKGDYGLELFRELSDVVGYQHSKGENEEDD